MMPVSLLQSIERHARALNLMPESSIGILAVSGGLDSMVLLHILTSIRDSLQISLTVATFDHGLRGAQGRADAEFVAQICHTLSVPCVMGSGALEPELPAIEARARAARYAFLADTARSCDASWLATAHHADDQVETVLLALTRGAGGHGLSGMRPLTSVPGAPALMLVRPLLNIPRQTLLSYARTHDIPWRDDPTNADPAFARNHVRMSVVPALKRINPQITEAVGRTSDLLAEQDDYLHQQASALLSQVTREAGKVSVPRALLRSQHPALVTRLLLMLCAELHPNVEIGAEHIRRVSDRARSQKTGVLHLPSDLRVMFESAPADQIVISLEAYNKSVVPQHAWLEPDAEYHVVCGQDIQLSDGWVLSVGETQQLPDVFLMPLNDHPVVLRARRSGDRLRLPDGHHQKLKDWFINRKIPQVWRDTLPLLVQGQRVCAVWDGARWHNLTTMEEGAGLIGVSLVWKNHPPALSSPLLPF
jgi:tRNA(Ile)-lysidine synthase